jgi:hypothetical protein
MGGEHKGPLLAPPGVLMDTNLTARSLESEFRDAVGGKDDRIVSAKIHKIFVGSVFLVSLDKHFIVSSSIVPRSVLQSNVLNDGTFS